MTCSTLLVVTVLAVVCRCGCEVREAETREEKNSQREVRGGGRNWQQQAELCTPTRVSVRVAVATENRKQQSMGGDTCMHTGKSVHTFPLLLFPATSACLCSDYMIKQQTPQE